jgi:hypothetical protein
MAEENNWILTLFIPFYKVDKDRTYHIIIQHGVAVLTHDLTKGHLLKSDHLIYHSGGFYIHCESNTKGC